MVKPACEICKTLYSSVQDAQKCESKGYTGPKIPLGLVLKNLISEGEYAILVPEDSVGHERVYSSYSTTDLREKGNFLSWNSLGHCEDIGFDVISFWIQSRQCGVLTKDEFQTMKSLVGKLTLNESLEQILVKNLNINYPKEILDLK